MRRNENVMGVWETDRYGNYQGEQDIVEPVIMALGLVPILGFISFMGAAIAFLEMEKDRTGISQQAARTSVAALVVQIIYMIVFGLLV